MQRTDKSRAGKREWLVIIAAAVILHLAFFVFFKPTYLRLFKTEIGGDDEYFSYPLVEQPFVLIPYPEQGEPVRVDEPAQTNDETERTEAIALEDLIGEPVTELVLLKTGKTGGGGEQSGPRRSTVEPKPLYIPWPKYPHGIRGRIEGNVELLVYVNEKGEVEHVKISSGLPSQLLNTTAVEAARNIRFTPGFEKGIPTAMWVRLTIGFQPR